MASNFKFDARAFERDLKKAVADDVNKHMKKVGSDLQRALDGVSRTHSGKPASEVRPALAAALRRADFTPDQEQLDSWSEAISECTKITVDVKSFRP
jgi:hypothetical protein